MKKFLSVILILLLLFTSTFVSSCNKEQTGDDTTAADTTETIEDQEDIVIAINGEAAYSLIRYIDAFEDEVSLLIDFRNVLNDTYNTSFALASDWTAPQFAPAADACEIIIGLTSREATQAVLDANKMGVGDCAVQICENNKIVIVAPDYTDLKIGFDYFVEHLELKTDAESGASQLVYNGGNYLHRTSEAHILPDMAALSEMQIVYDKDGKYKKYAENISKAIKKNYDIVIDVASETAPKAKHEIIVGAISDTSRFDYNYRKLSAMSYVIVTSDTSILIGGVNESAVKTATDYFTEKYIRTGNIVSMNLLANTKKEFNAFSAGDDAKLAAGADTRIMSFNMLSEEWDAAAVMEGRDIRVSSILLNYLPDVAALQEVSNAWYPILQENIGEVYQITRKKTPSGSGTYTTLIYNKTTTKLIEEGIHLYSVGNSQRLRSIVWGVFESISTGERYIVFSTHWDVGAERQGNRMIQASEMADLALSMNKKYNADVFVCGDYNSSESTSEYKSFIEKSGYVDAKTSAKEINLACKTYHTLFQGVSTGTYESIDHITFSKETQPKVLFYNTLTQGYVIDASDHCPIFIDVKLSK